VRFKIILLGFILFTFAPLAHAQLTSVSATVTDSDGQAWSGGSYSVTFVANPSFSGPYNFNGAPMTAAQQGPYNGALDGTGAFVVSLPSNALIAPAGTQWLFIICPQASSKCGQITTAVSGSAVSLTSLISAQVPAPRFPAKGTGYYGYSTVEISQVPVLGGSYWDVTLGCTNTWNGTAFACSGGGGGSSVLVNNVAVNSPNFSTSPDILWQASGSIINTFLNANPCFDIGGSVILNYDPNNTLGQGSFPCIQANRLNAVIQNPGAGAGPNVVTPADLSVPHVTWKLLASQTQPFWIFQDSSGATIGYLDAGMNLGVNSIQLLGTSVSDLSQVATPSGSAVAGRDFFFVGTDKLWHTKDDSGVETVYIGAASTNTLTNKTFDTGGTGNVFKIAGQPISSTTAAVSKVASADTTISGAPNGTLTCVNSGQLSTTACAGTVSAQRCVADEHCTYLESGPTAISVVGDTLTATGTFSGGTVDANHGPNVSASTTTTPNTSVGESGGLIYRTGRNIDMVFNGSFSDGSSGITNSRVMFCVTDQVLATQLGTSTPAGNWACFRYDTGVPDSVWRGITSNAGTATNTSTGITPDTNQHKYEIQFNDAIPNIVFSIDGTVVATNSTNLPASATNLRYVIGYQNLSTNNANFQISSNYIRSDN
jgi:hypothetical protein